MATQRIYLDNNASTPVDPRVVEVMHNALHHLTGNPSSVHSFGQQVRNEVTRARRLIAETFGARPSEVVFTSGGTESMNLLVRGAYGAGRPGHILTSNVEHACVYEAVCLLQEQGARVTYLPVGQLGAVDPRAVAEAIQPDTRFIALLAANNETGVRTDLEEIAWIAEAHQIPFLVDGVALLGKESFVLPAGVTGIGFSGHKIHAPAGTGFALIRKSLPIQPLFVGGGQEGLRRGGTENVVGILGLAEAMRLLQQELPSAVEKMRSLRNFLEEQLMARLGGVSVQGLGPRVSNTSSLSFVGVDGESLLMNLDMKGVAVSHGSACSSGSLEPSRISLEMGVSLDMARSIIRFSLSRFTTKEEIAACVDIVVDAVNHLRDVAEGVLGGAK